VEPVKAGEEMNAFDAGRERQPFSLLRTVTNEETDCVQQNSNLDLESLDGSP
jgi:hypothetical protein